MKPIEAVTRQFQVKQDGTIESPEGFRIERVPTLAEKRYNVQGEIDRIEAIKEPTDKELIQWARENHEYYREQEMVDFYKNDLKNYDKLLSDADNIKRSY